MMYYGPIIRCIRKARSKYPIIFQLANISSPLLSPLVRHPLLWVSLPSQSSLCHGAVYGMGGCSLEQRLWVHSTSLRNTAHEATKLVNHSEKNGAAAGDENNIKPKRKKLKGKRVVRRWLKHFRWKKKKEYERMTAEEKILYKLRKARNKEARLLEALKKIEPPESSQATHDPEILTPEEHFYFLKMGLKCKNYVPVGRRGIYQGVILNMHLHWKKHQTLQVIVKTFTTEEVKEIAVELARLSGGIVLDIHEEDTIIMYRGKNYSQPPTEIMSPKTTLPRIKALNKSKYRDGLRAVRKFIPRLEQDLELLEGQAKRKQEEKMKVVNGSENVAGIVGKARMELGGNDEEDESGLASESEELSDIFETDCDEEEEVERMVYMDELEKLPMQSNEDGEDFEEQLREMCVEAMGKKEHDEVDRMFQLAVTLLRKKQR